MTDNGGVGDSNQYVCQAFSLGGIWSEFKRHARFMTYDPMARYPGS